MKNKEIMGGLVELSLREIVGCGSKVSHGLKYPIDLLGRSVKIKT